MAYQQTPKTRQHRTAMRLRVLHTARAMVAEGGFGAVHMASVAHGAGLATGGLYRYFPCKADLLVDVFRQVTQREVDVMSAVAASGGPATIRLATAIEAFARRAMRAHTLAYALIFEPVDKLVETERLIFRGAYAKIIGGIIEDGIASGAFSRQNTPVVANCVVGALAEALIGPLAEGHTENPDETIRAISSFCLNAVTHPQKPEVTP